MPDSDTPGTPDGSTETPVSSPENGDQPLGEQGQRALVAMKDELKTAKAELREAKAAQEELKKLREANQSEAEKALEAARAEGDQTARTEMNGQLLAARVELAILKSDDAKKLADPSDALVFIDAAEITDSDGNVKAKALTSAIDTLLAAKPHLAAGAKRVTQVPGGPRTPGAPEPGPGKDRLLAAFADAE